MRVKKKSKAGWISKKKAKNRKNNDRAQVETREQTKTLTACETVAQSVAELFYFSLPSFPPLL